MTGIHERHRSWRGQCQIIHSIFGTPHVCPLVDGTTDGPGEEIDGDTSDEAPRDEQSDTVETRVSETSYNPSSESRD